MGHSHYMYVAVVGGPKILEWKPNELITVKNGGL